MTGVEYVAYGEIQVTMCRLFQYEFTEIEELCEWSLSWDLQENLDKIVEDKFAEQEQKQEEQMKKLEELEVRPSHVLLLMSWNTSLALFVTDLRRE